MNLEFYKLKKPFQDLSQNGNVDQEDIQNAKETLELLKNHFKMENLKNANELKNLTEQLIKSKIIK